MTLKHNGKTYTGNAFYNEGEEKNPPNSFHEKIDLLKAHLIIELLLNIFLI